MAFVTGALVLGAVATGMLLGHWYLIDLGLSIDRRCNVCCRYFVDGARGAAGRRGGDRCS